MTARVNLINSAHIAAAISYLDENGVDERNLSHDYCLKADNGHHYPPKEVLRRAFMICTNGPRPKGLIASGTRTAAYLRQRGYRAEKCGELPSCQERLNRH
jgi:hypothetical protein